MWWIIGILSYLIIVAIDVSSETDENFKSHDGGFLNMGYTTCDKRDVTPRDIRRGLIWPIRFLIFITCGVLWFMNDMIKMILLTFNIEYCNTKLYKKIDKFFYRM